MTIEQLELRPQLIDPNLNGEDTIILSRSKSIAEKFRTPLTTVLTTVANTYFKCRIRDFLMNVVESDFQEKSIGRETRTDKIQYVPAP